MTRDETFDSFAEETQFAMKSPSNQAEKMNIKILGDEVGADHVLTEK